MCCRTLWVEPVPPKQMAGELYKDFQLREHILFFLFFRAVCYQIQESIMSSLEYGKLNESVVSSYHLLLVCKDKIIKKYK